MKPFLDTIDHISQLKTHVSVSSSSFEAISHYFYLALQLQESKGYTYLLSSANIYDENIIFEIIVINESNQILDTHKNLDITQVIKYLNEDYLQ